MKTPYPLYVNDMNFRPCVFLSAYGHDHLYRISRNEVLRVFQSTSKINITTSLHASSIMPNYTSDLYEGEFDRTEGTLRLGCHHFDKTTTASILAWAVSE